MKSSELKALSAEELQDRLDATIKSLYELRLKATTKELARTSDIRATRRDIARIRQAIGEKNQTATGAGQKA